MRCEDLRDRLIDGPGRDPSAGLRPEMEAHLNRCRDCALFLDQLESVREAVGSLPQPLPSDRTDFEVRTLLKNAGATRRGPVEPLPSRWGALPIPRTIWAAIPVLLVLTSLVMASGLQDVLDNTGSLLAAAFVTLLLQNAAMLVFAPILIRALRRKGSPPSWHNGDAHAS